MQSKYIIGGLAVVFSLALFFIGSRSGNGAREAGKITLGPTICLAADSGYRPLADDGEARRDYLRQYWADSSRQFFSKTLISPEEDTLFVSVFNDASLKMAQELLLKAGFEPALKEQEKAGGASAIKMLARSADGGYFLRYLIDGGSFPAVAMADLPGRDSSRLARKFKTSTFTQKIEPCL